MRVFLLLIAGIFFTASTVCALGPHQVALIVNANSQESLTLANHYASLRKVPLENRIHVSLPASVLQAESQMSADEFKALVIEPVQKELSARGIQDRILAWVYSGDFPTRINGASITSLTGFTLYQGNLPEPQSVQRGQAASQFFAGIQGGGGPTPGPGYPFLAYRQTLKEKMPVPSMLLAHLGARGLTVEQAVDVIHRGVQAEGTMPKGTVFFEKGADIRTKTREFQFPEAVAALKERGVKAQALEGLPAREKNMLGVMAGRTMVFVPGYGSFRPGAYADHLTSFAAIFDMYHHTKCVEWLRHGATGTSGPVVEPMAIWTKFPSARLFDFYGRGFTLIESLFAATASPLQILFMGEPLSAPFNQRLNLVLLPLSGDVLKGKALLQGHTLSPVDQKRLLWRLSIDGIPQGRLGADPTFRVDTTGLSDGFHTFGVEAYFHDQPLIMGYSEQEIEISNLGRSVSASAVSKSIKTHQLQPITVTATKNAVKVGVLVNGVWTFLADASDGIVQLSPTNWGTGPMRWHAIAHYPDGTTVRGKTEMVELTEGGAGPKFSTASTKREDGGREWIVKKEETEGDVEEIDWDFLMFDKPFSLDDPQGEAKKVLEVIPLELKGYNLGMVKKLTKPLRLAATFTPPREGAGLARSRKFGLVYNRLDDGSFSYFGFGGLKRKLDLSALQE